MTGTTERMQHRMDATAAAGTTNHGPADDGPADDDSDDENTFDVGPGGDPRHPDQPALPSDPSSDPSTDPPDGEATPATTEALGLLSEAVEWIERARGRLYDFHQLTGHADMLLGHAADALSAAGHEGWATTVRDELVGRNVIEGRWTFQVVDEYDDTYWSVVRDVRRDIEDALADGRRHVHEAQMKQRRRTIGRRHHEAEPPEQHRRVTA